MIIYEVKSGDSVFSVARRFGVPPSRIITDNFLTDASHLVPGQDLVILFPSRTHTVRGGETLYSIAREAGVSVNTLYRNNPVLDGEASVFPGQVLNISYDKPKYGEISICGYAYPSIDKNTLRRTLPYLTYLSVFSYGIGDDGEISEPSGDVAALNAVAREYSTLPIFALTSLNSDGKFSQKLVRHLSVDATLRGKVIEHAYDTAVRYGFGGVDINIEYVPRELASEYAEFVKMLKERFGELKVFVSLAPKYGTDQKGQDYVGDDYATLGDAADGVFLKTYELGHSYGSQMSEPLTDRVREDVKYAVRVIPSERVALGLSNYGYDLALPYVRGVSEATKISNTEAVALARSKGANVLFDETAMSPHFTYYDRPETFSDAVKHELWFKNARSVESAMMLIFEHSLGGIGVWNIMNYFPQMWAVINSLCSVKKYSVSV